MSQRRAPPTRPPPPTPEEEEEEDDEEMDEGMDMFEALGSLLATEEGESIAEILKRQADSTEKLSLNIEMQNKILLKILTEIKKPATEVVA
jgi:hypothetical protein